MVENTNSEPLYIVLISVHGLIRNHHPELGRDADTGGQTKYVVELAKALAKQPDVERVDLITRRIIDSEVSPDYAGLVEPLAENAQIVRIEAGPEGYIRKEELWDHLDSFADNLLTWLHRQPRLPDILHSHYADAGYVGVRLSHWTGLPLIHTGHSLGRDKCRRLLAMGLTMEGIEQRYHMSRRIDAEEDTLTNADLVITSTRNEIEEQYELYNCYTPDKMAVIPPGTDLETFHPPASVGEDIAFAKNLEMSLHEPDKPMILALSRPDERKNIVGLLEAYGESPRLQQLANLVIIAGNRDDIRKLGEGPQGVLTELLLVDPLDKPAIAEALLTILENPERWREFSANGLQNVARYYSWDAHAQTYLQKIRALPARREQLPKTPPVAKTGRYRKQAIFTAIDNTLLGDADGLAQFVKLIREKRKKFLFGIATGRRLDSVLAILKTHRIPMPDILITSLGTEIYYAPQLIADIAWTKHIDHLWMPQALRRLIGGLPGLTPQAKSEQSRFKISYHYNSSSALPMEEILTLLRQQELPANATLSFGQFLDIVPARASKGQALRYIARQWNIPLERVLVTGGSGGDEDMLRGNTLGVVVANRHCEELSILGDTEHVYFAERAHAGGILEAIEHYDFFNL